MTNQILYKSEPLPKYKVGQKLVAYKNGVNIIIDVLTIWEDGQYELGWMSPKDKEYKKASVMFSYAEEKFAPYIVYNKMWESINE